MLGFSRDVSVRAFRSGDADMVCEFVNRFGLMTQRYAYPTTADDLLRGITENGVLGFYIATYREERVIGIVDYAPACFGFACPAGGLQARTLFVDPQFRMGPVISELFAQGVQLCLNRGYGRIDTLTIGANANALRLFRRAGFRQVSEPPVGAEEIVELVNFGPLLIRYLYGALADGPGLRSLGRAGAPFDFSRAFPPVAREGAPRDDLDWHGSRVVAYDVNLPDRTRFSCHVDLAIEEVTAVEGVLGELTCQPEGDRHVAAGSRTAFECRFRNTTGRPVTLTVEAPGTPEGVLTRDEPIGEGEGWTARFDVDAPASGRLRVPVEATVTVPDGRLAGRLRLPAVSWIETRPPSVARSRRSSSAGATLLETADGWRLDNRWVRATIDRATGGLTLGTTVSGAGASTDLVWEGWPDLGPPYPPTHRRPVARELHALRTDAVDEGVQLELMSTANVWWARDPAAVERWGPDIASLGAVRLRRTYHLGGDQLLRIDTVVERGEDDGDRATDAGGDPVDDLSVRTHIWALPAAASLTVPSDVGEVTGPFVHHLYPFMVDGFDHLLTPHLPTDPRAYAAPWTAVGAGDLVAGALWPDADEVRFGLRWMPSVLYRVGHLRPGESRPLPPLHLCAAVGDHRFVAAAWAHLGPPGPEPAATDGVGVGVAGGGGAPVRLHLSSVDGGHGSAGVARVAGRVLATGAPRQGHLSLDVAGHRLETGAETGGVSSEAGRFDLSMDDTELPPGVHQGLVTWRESLGTETWAVPVVVSGPGDTVVTTAEEGGHRIDGSTARVLVDGTGVIAALEVAGQALLGPNGATLHVVSPGRRWLHEPGPEDVPWAGRLAATVVTGAADGWAGVELGDPDGADPASPGPSYGLSILTRPGWPLAVARVRCTNPGPGPLATRLALTAQAAPGEAVLRYRNGGSDLELPAIGPGARQGSLPSGRCTAAGAAAGIVQAGEESFFMVSDLGASTRGWVDESGCWRLLVSLERQIAAGDSGTASFLLGRGHAQPGIGPLVAFQSLLSPGAVE